MVETGGGDLPAKLGVSRIMLAAGTEEEPDGAGLLGVVVVDSDQIAGVCDHIELVAILVHHEVVDRAGWI